MTLRRLAILLAILIFLAGVGIACLWQYAYAPQGRARVIVAQLKNETDTFRGWLLQHHLVRPGFAEPNRPGENSFDDRPRAAAEEMVKLGHDFLPLMIETLRDENHDARMMAIAACGDFGDPAAIQPLVKCLRDAIPQPPKTPSRPSYSQSDSDIQFECIESLMNFGPEIAHTLLEAAKHCDSGARPVIPEMLAAWGAEGVPPLMEMLEDDDNSVRASAARELGKLKDKRAIDALSRHLSDEGDFVAANSAKALEEIGDPKAIPALLKTLKNDRLEGRARIAVAGTLAHMGRGEGLKYLLSKIKSPSCWERADVAQELGESRMSGALEPLLSMLKDDDAVVRITALAALPEFHDPRVIPAVRKLLNDPHPDVRKAAAEALEKLV
jgi:HEAT repeat protein